MPSLISGQKVRIEDAPLGTPDPKALVYYDFMRGLTGDVIKVYADDTVAVSVDRKSMPQDILKRHEISEQSARDRWLNSLSEEDRNKLSEKDKKFALRYTVLVSSKHVVPEGAAASKPAGVAAAKKETSAKSETVAEPKRATSSDLSKAEQDYLDSIIKKSI